MRLFGSFEPPGDKSISHRIALFSLLAQGRCIVTNFSTALDCTTSLRAVCSLGVETALSDGQVMLEGAGGSLKNRVDVDCGNSGTTIRLLMGMLAGVHGTFTLYGDESLMKRPMERAAQPLRQMGASIVCSSRGAPPVVIVGSRLNGIQYTLPVASAQLKSAVLLAGTQADGKTELIEPMKSRDHTERLLEICGARLFRRSGTWLIEKSELTLPPMFRVPGDPSSAAFLLGAAALVPESIVTARAVVQNPTRIKYLDKFEDMGIHVEADLTGQSPEPWGNITVRYNGRLKPVTVTQEEMPLLIDEIPLLVLLATQAHGMSVFKDIRELRIKESDRPAALTSELGKMGADIEIVGNDMIVRGPVSLKPAARLQSFGDHRIAMTLAVACVAAGAPLNIDDTSCMAISYPTFLDTLRRLVA